MLISSSDEDVNKTLSEKNAFILPWRSCERRGVLYSIGDMTDGGWNARTLCSKGNLMVNVGIV